MSVYNYGNFPKVETDYMSAHLKGINSEDLIAMFGNDKIDTIVELWDKEIINKALDEYSKYEIQVRVGDIIRILDEDLVVTLVYTDKTADLVDTEGKKTNTGLYGIDFTIVGFLEEMEVEI